MELKFKRLDEKAILPIRAHKSDAGLDLTATDITLEPNDCGQTVVVYHTGLSIEIPEGYVGLLFPRSSIAKKSMFLTNSVGVIDSGYRGEIMAKMHVTTDAAPAIYKVGEKFAQLVIMPLVYVDIVEAGELSESDRGENGYGSSDKEVDSAANADVVENTNENDSVVVESAEYNDSVEPAADVITSEVAE